MLNTRNVIISLGMIVVFLGSCAKKEKKVEEAVTPAPVVEPGTSEQDLGSLTTPSSTRSEEYTIYFAFDDYTLNADAKSKLDRLAQKLKNQSGLVVQIEGHCDERGTVEYNLALGEKRAQSAKKYLVSNGINPSRISTISYGEEKPAVEGHDESAWSKNRRAEFVISGQ